jgi:hypothetical protein
VTSEFEPRNLPRFVTMALTAGNTGLGFAYREGLMSSDA